jgi:hypothetical protein
LVTGVGFAHQYTSSKVLEKTLVLPFVTHGLQNNQNHS